MDAGRESGGQFVRGAGGGQGGEEAGWRVRGEFCVCGEYEWIHL